jgi:hypothetical protein
MLIKIQEGRTQKGNFVKLTVPLVVRDKAKKPLTRKALSPFANTEKMIRRPSFPSSFHCLPSHQTSMTFYASLRIPSIKNRQPRRRKRGGVSSHYGAAAFPFVCLYTLSLLLLRLSILGALSSHGPVAKYSSKTNIHHEDGRLADHDRILFYTITDVSGKCKVVCKIFNDTRSLREFLKFNHGVIGNADNVPFFLY